MFREPCSPLHQGEEQPDTQLFFCHSFYITLLEVMGGKKETCGGSGGEVGEIGRSSITGRIVFHILFML